MSSLEKQLSEIEKITDPAAGLLAVKQLQGDLTSLRDQSEAVQRSIRMRSVAKTLPISVSLGTAVPIGLVAFTAAAIVITASPFVTLIAMTAGAIGAGTILTKQAVFLSKKDQASIQLVEKLLAKDRAEKLASRAAEVSAVFLQQDDAAFLQSPTYPALITQCPDLAPRFAMVAKQLPSLAEPKPLIGPARSEPTHAPL